MYSHVADQLALSLDATPPGTYRQRGVSSLQRLFRAHFAQLVARYEDEFAKRLGKFRLERITKCRVERFLACGDYRRGIARIKCTNPQGGSHACAARAPTADWSTFGPSAAASSIFGHKDERYLDFGLVPARADDIANWLPARISAIIA